MTPWRDCAPCHSQPDGARLPLTRHPAYGTSPPTRANSVREGHSLPTACRIPPAMAARPPSSCRCGCLAPPSSPSIGIWLGPFAFPYPSSMVSTTRTSRFGGFGLQQMLQRASGGNYPAITEPELEKILVPVPDAATQDFIATEVRHRREEARRLRAEAEAGWEGAKGWFEVQLFGESAEC